MNKVSNFLHMVGTNDLPTIRRRPRRARAMVIAPLMIKILERVSIYELLRDLRNN
jgi:hypothetical protein